MKAIFQIGLFCLLMSNLSVAQIIYTGSFDFKKENEFNLTSDIDTISITVANKKMNFGSEATNSFSFSKTRRNNFVLNLNSDTVIVVQTKRNISFSSGMTFYFNKKSAKQLILTDGNEKMLLSAEYVFKYPIASYEITIYEKDNLPELVSYSTYYLFEKSRNLKNDYETPYIYFGPY
jgi:hypothetical protein